MNPTQLVQALNAPRVVLLIRSVSSQHEALFPNGVYVVLTNDLAGSNAPLLYCKAARLAFLMGSSPHAGPQSTHVAWMHPGFRSLALLAGSLQPRCRIC